MITSPSRPTLPFLPRGFAVVRSALPLVRPLWLREQRERSLISLPVLSVAAALVILAYAVVSGHIGDQNDAIEQAALLTSGFRSTLGVVFAIAAVITPIDRLESTRTSGWYLPLVARGTPPASIVLGTFAAAAAGTLAAFTVSYLVFACGSTLFHLSDVTPLVIGYVAIAPALLAWTSFGTLAAVIARGRAAGIGLATAAVVVPGVWVTVWTADYGHAPPMWAMWIWAAVAPVPLHVASWRFVAERARYVVCALVAITMFSRRGLVPND